MRHLLIAAIGTLCATGAAQADLTWVPDDTRPGGTAGVSHTYPHDGNGSYELITTTSSSKANGATYWDPLSPSTNPFGVVTTLGNISALSFDYYKDSASTSGANSAPALRLYFHTTGGQNGSLVFEAAENGVSFVPSDIWNTADLLQLKLWQNTNGTNYNFGPSTYTFTLADWLNPAITKPAGTATLDANTLVFGLNASMGSGVPGFQGAVDNIVVGFAGNNVSSNFEVVPEPTNVALGCFAGLGALGMVWKRRRLAATTAASDVAAVA